MTGFGSRIRELAAREGVVCLGVCRYASYGRVYAGGFFLHPEYGSEVYVLFCRSVRKLFTGEGEGAEVEGEHFIIRR